MGHVVQPYLHPVLMDPNKSILCFHDPLGYAEYCFHVDPEF